MVGEERALVECGTQFWPRNGSGELKYTIEFHYWVLFLLKRVVLYIYTITCTSLDVLADSAMKKLTFYNLFGIQIQK